MSVIFYHLFTGGDSIWGGGGGSICKTEITDFKLPIYFRIKVLDTEANKFFGINHLLFEAVLLTRCYIQNSLRSVIDSETNHIKAVNKSYFL